MALRSRITPDKHGHHSCSEGKLFVLDVRHCAIFNIGYSRQVQYQIDLIHIYHLLYFEDTKRAIRSVNRRRTDNTMAKRKRTKGQITIYKVLHRKQKIEQHEPH